ncbi:MAG: hypothetical protein NWF04_10020 [Candidatus Bathyarchaeota archaeon]|nr:hypothetical protein [Candidatus Bathyarchaeota archaeon]
MDEVLELMERTSKRLQKAFDESRELSEKQKASYERLLQSKDATEAQRLQAFTRRMIAYERLDRISSQLTLLYTLQIFAFKVKVLEVTLKNMNEQLAKSGALTKVNEIEDIRKHIDSLKILVEAQYESLKDIKDKSKDLPYVF